MYAEDDIDRKSILDYLSSLFTQKIKREQQYIWCGLVIFAGDIGATGLLSEIEKAYKEKLLEEGVVNFEDIERELYEYIGDESDDEDSIKAHLIKRHRYCYPTEVIKSIQKWASFDQPTKPPVKVDNKKLGRNDPCFCGSGKKYKKCCL